MKPLSKLSRTPLLTLLLVICCTWVCAQGDDGATVKQQYLAELKTAGRSFSAFFYPNYARIHTLTEKEFVTKIESARNAFNSVLKKYSGGLEAGFVEEQSTEIRYYFDKLLLDYPNNHDTYAKNGGKTRLSGSTAKRLSLNLADFNKPALLANTDFVEYVKAYLYHSAVELSSKKTYQKSDNKMLGATWTSISGLFRDRTCREYWQSYYLSYHIENNGIKNIQNLMQDYRSSVRDTAALNRINAAYAADSAGRQGHLVKSYKTVKGKDLDLHIFLPKEQAVRKRPVYVYFHGGSWSEGKPDWSFSACEEYARKGWVAVAVEYRTVSRHRSLPFESVMDARSAIRWLRQHAEEYDIDTARIVATGNSAGGHLVLASAMATRWNERTDDRRYSPSPNVMLVNSGVYDLTVDNTSWIRKGLKNKEMVKEISPNHLSKSNLPPLPMIHGTADNNCPYSTAEEFSREMAGRANAFEFRTLEGANHYIWYDPRYTGQISKWRADFLARLGY